MKSKIKSPVFSEDLKQKIQAAIACRSVNKESGCRWLPAEIIESTDFWFHAAKDKFDEFNDLDVTDIDVPSLIAMATPQNFSFRTGLGSLNPESHEYRLLLLAGQVAACFDMSATRLMPERPNERKLACVDLTPYQWAGPLLRYKAGLYIKTDSICNNAIGYIQHPARNLNILDERMRLSISENLLNGGGMDVLFEEMRELGVVAKNPKNNGCLYSEILHDEQIVSIWKDEEGRWKQMRKPPAVSTGRR